jgi:hypothetical protein
MLRRFRAVLISPMALAALGLLLSACNPGPRAVGENVPLTAAPDLAGAAPAGSVVWRSPELGTAEHTASAYFIQPATVYRGRGSYFADLSPQQVEEIVATLTKDVREAIGRRFRVVDGPGPGVFTLQLILVRVVPPRPAYVASGPYNVSALAVGMPEAGGTTAGTMTVAGKFLDSQTSKLLAAFSSPVSPTVMDLPAQGRPARALAFADEASEQFASDLVKAIVRQRQNAGALPPG